MLGHLPEHLPDGRLVLLRIRRPVAVFREVDLLEKVVYGLAGLLSRRHLLPQIVQERALPPERVDRADIAVTREHRRRVPFGELEEYLQEHAKRESYALLTPPRVLLEVDDDLELGEFGIATRMVQPRSSAKRRVADEPEGQVEPGATMIYKAPPVPEGGSVWVFALE